jgi:hypothetical protein
LTSLAFDLDAFRGIGKTIDVRRLLPLMDRENLI